MAKYLILLLLPFTLWASFPPEVSGPILYRMHQGEAEKALTLYLEQTKLRGEEDFELLRQACIQLLESGMKSGDVETEVMCMFGAGIAATPSLIPILEKGIASKEMKAQVVAVHYLADLNHDEADELLHSALASPFLLTRLESAFELAQKEESTVIDQLHCLFYKVPEEVRALFAQIAVPIHTPASTQFLERMLTDSNRVIRLSTILEIGKSGRDELVPKLRSLMEEPDPGIKEAALKALALLKDEESKAKMVEIATKRKDELQLTALAALYELGEAERLDEIVEKAGAKDLYAIALLAPRAKEEKVQNLLSRLVNDENPEVRLNAAIAQLLGGVTPPWPLLKGLLLRGEQDTGLMQIYSPGHALSHWTQVEGATSLAKVYPTLASETALLRGALLKKTIELPPADFLRIARLLFNHHAYELISPLTELLINCGSEEAIALLKEMQQKAGAPLIRNTCNLALYRMNEKGPYEENLLKWVRDEKNHPIIRFKEDKEKKTFSRFEISPEETSQLLISAIEALASKQSPGAREALVHAIAYGNPKNKYALAGLLMRMTE